MNMKWISAVLLGVIVLLLILFTRRRSIVGIGSRNRHFKYLGKRLSFNVVSDGYFLQLEGNGVLIYPHNFEGPGSVTLFYADTGIPLRDRTWIEPNVSFGRALVESSHGFEVVGEFQQQKADLLKLLSTAKYPYVALTLPSRNHFSPLIMNSLTSFKSFVLLIAFDGGRKPSLDQIQRVLKDIERMSSGFREIMSKASS